MACRVVVQDRVTVAVVGTVGGSLASCCSWHVRCPRDVHPMATTGHRGQRWFLFLCRVLCFGCGQGVTVVSEGNVFAPFCRGLYGTYIRHRLACDTSQLLTGAIFGCIFGFLRK